MANFDKARALLHEFKGDKYLYGIGVLPQVGQVTVQYGHKAALVCDLFPGADRFIKVIKDSLITAGVDILGEINGAGPNAPREDLARITAFHLKLSLEENDQQAVSRH